MKKAVNWILNNQIKSLILLFSVIFLLAALLPEGSGGDNGASGDGEASGDGTGTAKGNGGYGVPQSDKVELKDSVEIEEEAVSAEIKDSIKTDAGPENWTVPY